MNEAVICDMGLRERAEKGADLLAVGVFSGGVYFSFPDGALLMLHDRRYGSLPFGAALDGFAGRGRLLGIEAGMPALLSGETLSIPAAGFAVSVRFAAAPVPSGRIAERFLREAVPLAAMPDDLFSRAAAPALEKLDRGLAADDDALLRAAVRGLLGLGTGLTPTYDDHLTGLLFCLHYAGQPVPALDRAVLDSLDRTNRYSAAFLRAAAEGGHFSLLADCLETGGAAALERLLSVGSSSGHDMLAGMVRAASFLASRKLA